MDLLRERWHSARTLLCIGLDSELERLPPTVRDGHTGMLSLDEVRAGTPTEGALVAFNQAIVDATADVACAFKPNSAFYEAQGPAGLRALQRTIAYIRARYPEVPVLLDAKRGDIGSTSDAYARAAFDAYAAHGITLHPYLGRDAIAPFLARADRGCFILCRTSNPGAGEFQDLRVRTGPSGPLGRPSEEPLYLAVARRVATEWNTHGNCGLVVGATYPEELLVVRAAVGDLPILVPGVGTQGGDLVAVLRAGLTPRGDGLLISASRSILYASSGQDFALAARREALRLREAIESLRPAAP